MAVETPDKDSYEAIRQLVQADDGEGLRDVLGFPDDIPANEILDAVQWLLAGMEAFAQDDRAQAKRAFERANPVVSRATNERARINYSMANQSIRARDLNAAGRYFEAEEALTPYVDELGHLAIRYPDARPIYRAGVSELAITRWNVAIATGRFDEASALTPQVAQAIEARGEEMPDEMKERFRSEATAFEVNAASTLAEVAVRDFDFELAATRLRAAADEAETLAAVKTPTTEVRLALARRRAIAELVDLAKVLDRSETDAKALETKANDTATELDELAKFADEDVSTYTADEVEWLGRAARMIGATVRSAAEAAQPKLPLGSRGAGLLMGGLGVALVLGGIVLAAFVLEGWTVIAALVIVFFGVLLAILGALGLQAKKAVPVIKAFSDLFVSGGKLAEGIGKARFGPASNAGTSGTGAGGTGTSGTGTSARGTSGTGTAADQAGDSEPAATQPRDDQPTR